MPLYEYRCAACSREFELLRPMDMSTAKADCPSCGEPSTPDTVGVRRLDHGPVRRVGACRRHGWRRLRQRGMLRRSVQLDLAYRVAPPRQPSF